MVLTVERLAWGGLGLARDPEGRLILLRAPLALFPGEEVRARVRMKARHGEGEVVAWTQAAASRVTPACPVAETCGGCELWGAGEQLPELKRAMVADLLQRQLPDAPAWTWHPAPPEAMRHRIQLHWDGRGLGFHRRKSHEVVAVEGCPASVPVLSQAIAALRAALDKERLPARPGRWELATGTPAKDVWAVDGRGRAWRLDGSAWHESASEDTIRHQAQGVTLHHRPGGFFQVCPPWAMEALATQLFAWNLTGDTLFDLYGGVGLFTALAGGRFRQRVLVEWESTAVALAEANLRSLGLPTACLAGDVGAWLQPGLGGPSDVVVLDPPRAGLEPPVAAVLQHCGAGALVLMGCDGASFCRDVKRLAPRWRLERLAVLDFFPNTHHVECLGLLRPSAS